AVLYGASGAVIIAYLALFTWTNGRQRRIDDLRTEVGRLVESVISDVLSQPDSPTGSTELEAEVVRRVGEETAKYERRREWRYAKDLASEEEVRRRLQLRAAADEKTRSAAEKVILELLPPLPRTAERLLNRLYLLLVVAYNRNLIAHHRVSAEQLGKWAALLDRWPEAGKAIIKNPQLAQELEAAEKRKDTFATLCSSHTPPLASDPAPLRRFFQTDHKLAAAAYHLLYLDAGVEPPPSSSTPATRPAAGA